MADNYLQFSLAIQLKNDEEKEWCISRFRELSDSADLGEDISNPPDDQKETLEYAVRDSGSLEFDWSFENVPDDEGHIISQLWIRASQGTPEHVALFLKEYLVKFNPEGGAWFSWAATCSKLRINEFTGGSCAVTASRVEFFVPDYKAIGFLDSKGLVTRGTNLADKVIERDADKVRYAIDLPTINPESEWINFASDLTKDEALQIVKDRFGADEEGKIEIISRLPQEDTEEEPS